MSKWEAKSESQTQLAPCDPTSRTRLSSGQSRGLKALWFCTSVFCVYWRCPSVNVQSGVWKENERISRGFRNQMNKTWTGAVCSTPFDYYEERCLWNSVCVCLSTNVCRFQAPLPTAPPFLLVIMLSGQKKGLQESNKENQWVIWTASCRCKCLRYIPSDV